MVSPQQQRRIVQIIYLADARFLQSVPVKHLDSELWKTVVYSFLNIYFVPKRPVCMDSCACLEHLLAIALQPKVFVIASLAC